MISGAMSHIRLTGRWLARKSPPYTVSSRCFAGESPSPFVLTAPLMPPCAHTECDSFTGTTEIRSTSCPASAIFIAAASPASPPPTIAILRLVGISTYFEFKLLNSPPCLGGESCKLKSPWRRRLNDLLLFGRLTKRVREQAALVHERDGRIYSDRRKKDRQSDRRIQSQPLCLFTDHNSPIDSKQPEAVRK